MTVFALPIQYLLWHYSRALRDMVGIWGNYLWFIGNLFSVKTLFRTLIQPLKLIEEEKGNLVADPARFAQNLLVNIIMRLVGLCARLILILIACVLWVVLLFGGVMIFLLWLVLPVALFALFGIGVFLVV
jgi:hypothetical protein